jgi:hypothetical protein
MGRQPLWYGGKHAFKKSNIVNFGAEDARLKNIAGVGFTCADSLVADPGLRVYAGGAAVKGRRARENPDNITLGDGIALAGFFKGWTLDLASSEYSATPRKTLTFRSGAVKRKGGCTGGGVFATATPVKLRSSSKAGTGILSRPRLSRKNLRDLERRDETV